MPLWGIFLIVIVSVFGFVIVPILIYRVWDKAGKEKEALKLGFESIDEWEKEKKIAELEQEIKVRELEKQLASLENDKVEKGKISQEATERIEQKTKKYHSCLHCGEPIENFWKKCTSCNQPIVKCNVCKQSISFGEEAGKCSLCEAVGHFSHIQEWVKIKGKCPSCLQELPVDGIVPVSETIIKK